MQTDLRSARGFTVLEGLVALFLTVVVTGLVLTTYRLTARAAETWRRSGILHGQTHLLVERLAADLAGTARVVPPTPEAADTVWVLAGADARHAYRWSAGVLYRDGRRLHTPELTVTALTIRSTPPADAFVLPRARLSTDTPVPPRRMHVRLTTRAWRDTLTLDTAVVLRHAPPWPPPMHVPATY